MYEESSLYCDNISKSPLKPYCSLTQSPAYRSCVILNDIASLHISSRLSIKDWISLMI